MTISRARLLIVVALIGSFAAVVFWWNRSILPQSGSPLYEEYVRAFEVGVAALHADVPQQAQQSLSQAITLVPQEPAAWANRGLLAIRDGRLDEAFRDLKEAERLALDNGQIQQLLGLCESRRGQLKSAAGHFRAALDQEPKNIKTLYQLALVIDAQRDPDSAVAYQQILDRILAIQPDNLFVLQGRLRGALQTGDRPAARAIVERLKGLAGKWSKETRAALAAFDGALADPATQDLLTLSLPLLNLMRPEPGFARDAAAVDADDRMAGAPLETMVRLAPPRHKPSAADIDIVFSSEPFPQAPPGRWNAIQPVWLAKQGGPTVLLANEQELRTSDGKQLVASPAISREGLVPIDWNNDFAMDLFLAGPSGLRFFVQRPNGSFDDVSAAVGLPEDVLKSDCEAAWEADFDLDGDLDIVVAKRTGPPFLLRNNFDGTFRPQAIFKEVDGAKAFAWIDLDQDGAPDAVLIDAHGRLHVYANERSGVFQPWPQQPANDAFLALAVGDALQDGVLGLIAVRQNGSLVYMADRDLRSAWDVTELAKWESFPDAMKLGAVRLLAADLDNNGVPDLVVSGPGVSRIWLGDAVKGQFTALKTDLTGGLSAAVDVQGQGRLDLLGLDEKGQPIRLVNRGVRNYHWQVIRPVSQSVKGDNRINSFGLGGAVEIRSGTFFLKQPISGPAIHFGLGDRSGADVVRIQWPNGTSQVDFSPPVDATFEALQRLKGSCPFLFAWNGDQFGFVTDFMWSTPLGMYINAQNTGHIGRTIEWVKIRGEQLLPREGSYEIRVQANLWETHYFDHLSLQAVDHPDGTELVVDERFSPASTGPTMLLTGAPRPAPRAWDHKGQDVTELVSALDGKYLDHCERGIYQGIASEHWVEIQVPDQKHPGPMWLLAKGWVHPSDSSINFAMEQGKHTKPHGLVLENPDGQGGWKIARENLGFPAGKHKTMAIRLDDIEGLVAPRHVRLRTNMEVFWDALQFAEGREDSPMEQTRLSISVADLRYRGIIEMTQANRSSPELPHYDRVVAHGQHWRDLIGWHTRHGDIGELLERVDDRYAILCAGDEVVLKFPAPPGPPAGWKRDFVWISDGWVKDGDLNTRFGKTVLPLPSHDAKSYDVPIDRLQDDPVYQRNRKDWENYHTRYVTPNVYNWGLRGKIGR